MLLIVYLSESFVV